MEKIVNIFTDIVISPFEENKQVKDFVNGSSMNIGSGALSFKVDSSGLWLGGNKFSEAPFRVDMSGNAVMSSIALTGGTISFGKTSFTDTAHSGYYIGPEGMYLGGISDAYKLKFTIATGVIALTGVTLDWSTGITGSGKPANNATVGATWNSNISGQPADSAITNPSYITSTKITATTIETPTITSGTITGSTVRTASSGARVQMSGSTNYLQIFDSSYERIRLQDDSLYFYDPSYTSGYLGRIFATSGLFLIENPNANYLWLKTAYSTVYGVGISSGTTAIAIFTANGLHMQGNIEITATYAHINCITLSNNSPLGEDGTIYYNSGDDHFYGRCNGAWRQLDN